MTAAPYVNIFAGGPDGSLGKTLANDYRNGLSTQNAVAAPVRNALLPAALADNAQPPIQSAPDLSRVILSNAIGHAALLSDTPEKWDATLAMLRANGIDPKGYEDFDKGRALAIAGSNAAPNDESANG